MAAIVQGLLVKPLINRFGERNAVVYGLTIQACVFVGYGLASQSWMILAFIMVGSLGGISGPAIQSIVAGSVEPQNQGKVQGAITSLTSLTNIIAPLVFTAGIFSYFTSEDAIIQLPGAPFLVGSVLLFASMVIAMRVFKRLP